MISVTMNSTKEEEQEQEEESQVREKRNPAGFWLHAPGY